MIPGFEDGLLIGANGALIADNRQIKPAASIRLHDLQLVTEMVAEIVRLKSIFNQLDSRHLPQRVGLPKLDEVIKVILLRVDEDAEYALKYLTAGN